MIDPVFVATILMGGYPMQLPRRAGKTSRCLSMAEEANKAGENVVIVYGVHGIGDTYRGIRATSFYSRFRNLRGFRGTFFTDDLCEDQVRELKGLLCGCRYGGGFY